MILAVGKREHNNVDDSLKGRLDDDIEGLIAVNSNQNFIEY